VLTGRAGLDILDAPGAAVDVVLIDHHLPDAGGGLDLLDAIHARVSPPAVVMIAAHGSESLAAAALRRGADDYLASDASLTHLLPEVLERVRRTRELRRTLTAAEDDLVRAERLAAIGEMLVTLNHEINNPLTSALADVELLLIDPDTPAELRREGLESVRDALQRIAEIVRRIGRLRQAPSKVYGSHTRMVDLEGASEAVPPGRHGVALLCIGDEDLSRVVALLLRHAGFDPRRATTSEELRTAAAAPEVTLVVVGGAAAVSGTHPLGGFTPAEPRGYRVVALVAGRKLEAGMAGVDLVIPLPFDPGTFAGTS
ncbi:MAG: response regulator, partial [Gemmatimonadales bacterium]|nr:response regulator [Gemmatimonadales bacterium]